MSAIIDGTNWDFGPKQAKIDLQRHDLCDTGHFVEGPKNGIATIAYS